ncbi:MAG TPA: STAS domain-containing protein, partial [Vicinamibacteria bacterium]|nr:STAS domain-containing protein [Vicinamibacteria bacterium]
MQFLVEQAGDARILRVTVAKLTYIDSATIGCLVEIHRLLEDLGGSLTLTGLHRRVETMLSMTGVLQFLNVDG